MRWRHICVSASLLVHPIRMWIPQPASDVSLHGCLDEPAARNGLYTQSGRSMRPGSSFRQRIGKAEAMAVAVRGAEPGVWELGSPTRFFWTFDFGNYDKPMRALCCLLLVNISNYTQNGLISSISTEQLLRAMLTTDAGSHRLRR
jgi:hypothetical protein